MIGVLVLNHGIHSPVCMPVRHIEVAVKISIPVAIHISVLIDYLHENGTKLGLVFRICVYEINCVDLSITIRVQLHALSRRKTLQSRHGNGIESDDFFSKNTAKQRFLMILLYRLERR